MQPRPEPGHIPIGFGAAHEEQFSSVGGGPAHVQELPAGQFCKDDARHPSAGQSLESLAQGDAQALPVVL